MLADQACNIIYTLIAVKHCVKLRTSRGYRLETQRLLLTGVAPLAEVAAGCSDVKAHTLLVCNGDAPHGLPPADTVISVTPAVMRKLAGLNSPPTGRLRSTSFTPARLL
jgi:hypothetical protein